MLGRALVALLLVASASEPAWAFSSADGERLLGPGGVPQFIVGMNYEGPADRAWQMWHADKFDASAIEADFARAQSAGVNAVRVFVQAPLAIDIAAGKFDKLDTVVQLAEQHRLQLVVSLHDYGERDLARVSAMAGQIAQHYRNRVGILAFDLKNEPRFGDIALARYPSAPPLQQRALIDTFGERLARDELTGYRASDDGEKTIPSYLSDDEAWVYINNLRLYREMLAEAAAWTKTNGGTTLDYLAGTSGRKWAPLTMALNATLQAWISPQLQAIRTADPLRTVTVDHVDVVLASLAANDALDLESIHRYPADTGSSIRANLKLLSALENAHAGKPFLWSEFGYATENLDSDKASLAETAILLGALAQHAAGAAKWMLNDMPQGYNMRERTLGAFRLDGSPKPVVGAFAALRSYLNETGSPPGDLRLEDDAETGVRLVYTAADALLLGGKKVDGGAAAFEASGAALLFITWTEPNTLHVWASRQLTATLDLRQLFGGSAPKDITTTRPDGRPVAPATRAENVLTLSLEPGDHLVRAANVAGRSADYDIPGGHFFTQTNGRTDSAAGFSVTDSGGIPLWTSFNRLGGVGVLGYPVSRRFEMDGFTLQAFQKAILQWRPDRQGFAFLNTFDVLHDRGRDGWLQVYRQTPPPADWAADSGLPWERVVQRHVALLDKAPAPLKDAFLGEPDWLDHYGLPVALDDTPAGVVVRAQRAALQFWKVAVPWAAAGSVTVANGGDLAKEAGVFSWVAVTPENAPR